MYPNATLQDGVTNYDHKPPSKDITQLHLITQALVGKPQHVKVKIIKSGTKDEIKPGLYKLDCVATDETGTMRYSLIILIRKTTDRQQHRILNKLHLHKVKSLIQISKVLQYKALLMRSPSLYNICQLKNVKY